MNPHYHTFIIEMIKHGDKQRAYQKTYPKAKAASAIKGAERLLRNPQIAAEIREAITTIHAEAYAKACAVHEGIKEVKILSIMKKREILTQLATCEMKVGRYVKGQYDYVMVFEDPRPRDIIRAIELDTKLEEMLNNARNIEDVKLSRFDIYIDGRPCDDPTAPINPNIPQGLVMLPRKKKNIPESTGNNLAERLNEATKKDINNGVKKEQNSAETLRLCDSAPAPTSGCGVQNPPDFRGNKKEQNSAETLRLCGSALAPTSGCRVQNPPDFRGNNLAQRFNKATKNDLNPGVKKEQKTTDTTLPPLTLNGDAGPDLRLRGIIPPGKTNI